MGWVAQDHGLVQGLAGAENVGSGFELRGLVAGVEASARAQEALAEVGLDLLGSRTVETLSSGQRQRVAVAQGSRRSAGAPPRRRADGATRPGQRHRGRTFSSSLPASSAPRSSAPPVIRC